MPPRLISQMLPSVQGGYRWRIAVAAVSVTLIVAAVLIALTTIGQGAPRQVQSPFISIGHASPPQHVKPIALGFVPYSSNPTVPSRELFADVIYPQQMRVGTMGTVTLHMSVDQNVVLVSPASGSGTFDAESLYLPASPSGYDDIYVEAKALADLNSPVVWQMTSAPRQSLLQSAAASSSESRTYRPEVAFTWTIRPITSATQNPVGIEYSVYLKVAGQSRSQESPTQSTTGPIPSSPHSASRWIVAAGATHLGMDSRRRFARPLDCYHAGFEGGR